MGWIPQSSAYFQVHVGSNCYVQSCQALKNNATRCPKRVVLIRSWEASGHGSLPQVVGRGDKGMHAVKSCSPALNHRVYN
jgi:hypothetical protein